ncbi:hypothetical protein V8D89_005249 [Ganoderma adspersum]
MAGATSRTTRTLPDVPDILYHVFSYLDPVHQLDDDAVYESRRSLAIAARTCQGFVGPALDVLWRRLPDDQPLADLLCALDIAEMEKPRQDLGRNKARRYHLPNQDEGGYRLSGAAEEYEERWRLSRGYDIKYVRILHFHSFCGASTTLASMQGGRDSWSGAPVLPRLLSVAFCHISTRALTPGALALISPSIRRLNFNLESACTWPPLEDKLRSLFSQSVSLAPEIEKLRLELLPSILGFPLMQTHCSYVRHLEVFPQLDPEELQILTTLPALQSLSISLSALPQGRTGAALPLQFESITALVIQGTWPNLSALLENVLLPSLHTLSVTGWDYGEQAAELANTVTQCFHTISAKHPFISSLTVSVAPGRTPPSRSCLAYGFPTVKDTFKGALLDLVHPLLSLSSLRTLSLGFPSYFDIACTSADWRAVAESLRALEAFHLRVWPYFGFAIRDGSCPRERERPRGGPLDALAHFARCCPRLRLLHLPALQVAEDPVPVLTALHRDVDEPHGLRTLIVPRVLLPAGRPDLVGTVSEVVRAAFPLVTSAFLEERFVVEGDWAVAEGDLRCPEVLNGAPFDEWFDSKSCRKALACLARSHSTFTRPAVAAIWRSLPSPKALEHILCLVGIVQQHPKQERHRDLPPLEVYGTLATHESAWVRFQEYASLVREIIVDPFILPEDSYSMPLEDTFWYRLSSAFGDMPILPRLEVATIRSRRTLDVDAGVLRLLNPSTRELDVNLPNISWEQVKQLEKPFKDCVSLMQNLEILWMRADLGELSLDRFLDLESFPLFHPRLRSLTFRQDCTPSVELNCLRHLAALPDLENLTINLHSSGEPASFSVTFERLSKLAVSCSQFHEVGIFFAHIDAPRLRSLSVTETWGNTDAIAQELPNHLHTLVAKCPALTAFELDSRQAHIFKVGYMGQRRVGAPLAELIAHLLGLRTMQRFSAWFSGPAVPYTPADLRGIAEAWPNLEAFTFSDSEDGGWSPGERYADVESVAAFARHCPRLRSLHIPTVLLDSPDASEPSQQEPVGEATTAVAPDANSTPAKLPHSLRSLYVHHVGRRDGHRREGRDSDYWKEDGRQFRALMQPVFPSAVIHVGSESAIVMHVASLRGPPSAVNGVGNLKCINYEKEIDWLSALTSTRYFSPSITAPLSQFIMPATSPPTSTPRPGLNDVIFYHILSHLSPSPHPQASSSGFPETNDSSSFTQPALAEMWRSLPGTEPLEHLLCVVGIAQRRPAGDSGTPALEMCGTPATHKSGWLRFQEYASLVREITVDPLSHTGRDVYTELLQDTFWCHASIELDSLRPFANLPNLENLDINIRSWDPRAPINPSMTFPQLRSLAVTCDEPAVVGSFVDHIDTPRLQAFSLHETHRDSNPTMQSLSTQFRTLVTKCPALVAFTWLSGQLLSGRRSARGAGTFDGERRSGAPLAELLAPLLSHRAMRHFSVSFRGPIVPYTPGTDFPAMAKAWPDLETFHLSDYVDYIRAERYMDIESIAAFARLCPHLRSLHLPMVYFDPSSESAVVGEWACPSPAPHWLQEFFVGKITIPCSGDNSEQDLDEDRCSGDDSEQDLDEGRCREAVVQFRRLMATVFRSAVIRTRSEIATVMMVDPVV